MKNNKKYKIKDKILLLVLSTALISLGIFQIISYINMKVIGDFALTKSVELGSVAAAKSAKGLEEQTQKYIVQIVKNQAGQSKKWFETVELQVTMLSEYIEATYKNQSKASYWPAYEGDKNNKPKNEMEVASYKLLKGAKLESVKKEFDALSNIDFVTKDMVKTNSIIDAAYIGTETGIYRTFPWFPTDESYDLKKRPWYTIAMEAKKIGWTDVYNFEDDYGNDMSIEKLYITCSMPFKNAKGELAGVAAADIPIARLQSVITNEIKDIGYAVLLDKNGKVIIKPGLDPKSYKVENLIESTKDEDFKSILKKMINGEEGIIKCVVDGEEKFVAYAPVDFQGWSFAVIVPATKIKELSDVVSKEIESSTNNTVKDLNRLIIIRIVMTLLFFVFIIIAVVVASLNTSKKISKPILSLNEGVKSVGTGKLDDEIVVKTGDEIEDLANAFNKMREDLKLYISDLKETTAAKERIESELKVAQTIQESFLPRIFPAFPNRKEFDIFSMMDPAKEVGGDLYDFFLIGEDKLGFVIADVSGKGVPAALFMVIAKTLIKNEAEKGDSVENVLTRVNNIISAENDECMFITTFFGILNLRTGEVQFSNAGHNPPLTSFKGKPFEYMKINKGFVLAGMPNFKFKAEYTKLEPGDILFMYTDGVTEAMDIDGNLFGDQHLQDVLVDIRKATSDPKEIIRLVRIKINEHVKDAPQSDDITMQCIVFNEYQK